MKNKVDEKKREKVAAEIRKAVKGQVAAWNAMRRVEKLIGFDIDGEEGMIDYIAISCDCAGDAGKLETGDLIEQLEQLTWSIPS